MTELTAAQALAFIDALESENNAAAKPCPELDDFITECRTGDRDAVRYLSHWPKYDGDRWEAASLVEYANGQLAVVVSGDGPRGVVMLADGRFYPVTGNPSAEWTFAHGDDHPGFATLAEG